MSQQEDRSSYGDDDGSDDDDQQSVSGSPRVKRVKQSNGKGHILNGPMSISADAKDNSQTTRGTREITLGFSEADQNEDEEDEARDELVAEQMSQEREIMKARRIQAGVSAIFLLFSSLTSSV